MRTYYDQIANRGVPLTDAARDKPVEIGTGSRKSTERNFARVCETGDPSTRHRRGRFSVQDANGNLLLTRMGFTRMPRDNWWMPGESCFFGPLFSTMALEGWRYRDR